MESTAWTTARPDREVRPAPHGHRPRVRRLGYTPPCAPKFPIRSASVTDSRDARRAPAPLSHGRCRAQTPLCGHSTPRKVQYPISSLPSTASKTAITEIASGSSAMRYPPAGPLLEVMKRALSRTRVSWRTATTSKPAAVAISWACVIRPLVAAKVTSMRRLPSRRRVATSCNESSAFPSSRPTSPPGHGLRFGYKPQTTAAARPTGSELSGRRGQNSNLSSKYSYTLNGHFVVVSTSL